MQRGNGLDNKTDGNGGHFKGTKEEGKDEAAVEGVRDEQSMQVVRCKAGGEKGLSISHRRI